MSYESDYSDNCDEDNCYSNDVHSVDSYDSIPSSKYSYDGAPSENCCPCQPVQIHIFSPENVYLPRDTYDGNHDYQKSDTTSTACDHGRSDHRDNGDADDDISRPDDYSRNNNPRDDESRNQIKDKI